MSRMCRIDSHSNRRVEVNHDDMYAVYDTYGKYDTLGLRILVLLGNVPTYIYFAVGSVYFVIL